MQPTTAAPAAPTTSAGALSALQTAQSAALTPQQAADQANQANGVTGAQSTVNGLRGAIQQTTSLLNNVAPSVYGRTANSLVTDAQAGRQIQNETAPIQADLTKNNTDLSNANSDLTAATTRADSQAANKLSAQNTNLSYLQGIYGDLYKQEQDKQTQANTQAALAEQQRQFNATSHGSTSSSPVLVGGTSTDSGTSASAAGQAPPPLAAGTNPNAAVQQLFAGYNPASDTGYTENVVLPAIARLMAVNNPKASSDVINSAAKSLVYNYRHSAFGE